MIDHSEAYGKAVVSDSRRQFVRVVFDLYDPDMIITNITTNDESDISLTDQVTNRGTTESEQNIATLEPNRWILNGTFNIRPDDPMDQIGQVGWVSESLCDSFGTFSEPYPYIEFEIQNLSILQAFSFRFSEKEFNGIGTEFTLDIYSGDTLLWSDTKTGNKSTLTVLDGFTVQNPTKIRVTIKKWSLGGRRVRIPRLMVGLYEVWDTSILKSVETYSEVTFSGLSIPYSTCTVVLYNESHRFDPYAPNTLFTSIEDRQRIIVDFGMRLEDGSVEWLPAGTYYQQSAGWKLKDLTVQFDLLDIIGALTKRKFVVPDVLPTTLAAWVEAIMFSLGVNFQKNYIVDDDVKDISITSEREEVADKKCGEMLRFACMATNTWPRQDFETGKLRVGKLQRIEGNRITLDNMSSYPEMSANDDISDITFTLDNGEEVVFPGNNTESEVSLSVDNPFIHTTDDARKAVISCLFEYGGRSFEVQHRGNPSSECGDIQSVDTQFLTTISARLYKQQLSLEDGVMVNMPSYLVQSPNDSAYSNKTILTGSGTFVKEEAGKFRITLIGGGAGGMGGGAGNILWGDSFDPEDTAGGIGGDGGNVFITELTAIANQQYDYACGTAGKGGAGGETHGSRGDDGEPGTPGTDTTFGVYTSANGKPYPVGIMDIQSGAVYAQKGPDYGGIITALEGSGGAGGEQGRNGKYAQWTSEDGYTETYIASYPKDGTPGQDGKPGCIIVEW